MSGTSGHTSPQRQNADAAGAPASSDGGGEGTPLLRVVRGNPSLEELAALIAVVATRGGKDPEPTPAPSLWARPALRTPHSPGPGAWRASTLPR